MSVKTNQNVLLVSCSKIFRNIYRSLISTISSLFWIILGFFIVLITSIKDIVSYFKNGQYKKYYENGNICSNLNYKNGNLHGNCIWYFENGNKFKEEEYENGIPHGKVIGYHENGEIGKVGHHKDGKNVGEFIYYNDKGEIISKCIFKSGEPWEGKFLYWYDLGNGIEFDKLKEEIVYKNGLPNGEWVEYYEDGQISHKGTYKNGERDGTLIRFYENDQKSIEGNFINGIENGIWKYYSEDGKLWKEESYKDGELIDTKQY